MKKNPIMADRLLYRENTTSWKRIWKLFRLYAPAFRQPIIIYIASSLLLTILTGGLVKITGQLHEFIIALPASILFICSPVILTRHDYRPVSSQLPVNATEKLVLLLIMFWIAIPLILTASITSGIFLSECIFEVDIVSLMPPSKLQHDTITGLCLGLCLITIELHYQTKARSNRTGVTLLSAFIGYVSFILIAGVTMGGIGFYIGFTEAADAQHVNLEKLLSIAESILDTLLVAMTAIYLVKLFKLLRNHGF